MLHALRTAPRQTLRGCTTLPVVGAHPGTSFLLLMIAVSGLAGAQDGGVIGFLFSALAAGIVFGAIFAIGAHGRATWSDRHRRRAAVEALLEAWVLTRSPGFDKPVRIGFRITSAPQGPSLHIWRDNPPYTPDTPRALKARIEDIFTAPLEDMPAAQLKDAKLHTLHIDPRSLSAHERLTLHARLTEAGLDSLPD